MFRSQLLVKFFISLCILVTVLFYQNCSSSNIFESMSGGESNRQDKNTTGGNGGGYDGKTEGYVRLVPGSMCENNQIAIGSLILLENSALIISADSSCQQMEREVPFSELEFSSFSKKYIGYDGGVYTYFENKQDSIDKKIFTEAWCRAFSANDRSKSEVEIAIEWQESGKIAKMSLYTQKSSIPNEISANRTIDVASVTYSSGGGVLKINTDTKLSAGSKFAGYYSGYVDGVYKKISVECLMGGQFDITAPEFNYSAATDRTLVVGESLKDLVPQINKQTVAYSLEGSLPEGLVFNSNTGEISGVPQTVSARKIYSVTAKFKFGEINKSLSIGVGKMVTVDQGALNPNSSSNCDKQMSGCDLAGAVALANQMAPIPLVAKVSVPLIVLSGSELALNGDLSLIGLDTKTEINARQLSRHFSLGSLSYLELRNLKLVNGKADFGGSVKMEKAMLSVKDSVFANNYADDGISQGRGGAIFSIDSSLEIFNSEFYRNKTRSGGESIEGGAIALSGGDKLVINKSVFKENHSVDGGAVSFKNINFGTIVILTDSIFEANLGFKGAALNIRSADFLIRNSQFLRNESKFDGSSMYVLWSQNGWIYDSIFDGNVGFSGIFWSGTYNVLNFAEYSSLTILKTQFANHRSSSYAMTGGVLSNYTGQIILKDSTLKDNSTLTNCKAQFTPPVSEFLSLGGNTSSDNSCPR